MSVAKLPNLLSKSKTDQPNVGRITAYWNTHGTQWIFSS
jgi:hypothetical protein